MNCRRFGILLLAACLLFLYNGRAQAAPACTPVTAKAAVVMEQGSRRVLFEKDAHVPLPMASTTKIMTALVALEHGTPGDTVTVSRRASAVGGSSIYLKAGEKLTLEQLLYGLMLQSGNDAATAIAEHVGGSVEGFLKLMNARAEEIGAADTHFTSVSGLDAPGHRTTACDLALITAAAMDNDDFRCIVSTQSIRIPYEGTEGGRLLTNKNRILQTYEGCNGVKTGFTDGAGRCFVGSAVREGMQLISVVLNCGPMFEEAAALMDEAFARYDMIPVIEPNVAYGAVQADEGILGAVRYGAAQRVVLPLDAEEQGRVFACVRIPEAVDAPVAEGQLVGEGTVVLDGNALAQFPVIALESDERRTYLWYFRKVAGGFLWRKGRGGSGFRNIFPSAESPRAASARN